jgi:periplasmic divalent cation tolerance protein
MSGPCVLFVTVPSGKEAKILAESLVKEKVAACVTLLGGARSHYRWKGKAEWASEFLLMIKTGRRQVPSLIRRVKALHSYTVPEIIALPIVAGNRDYLKWMESCLKG